MNPETALEKLQDLCNNSDCFKILQELYKTSDYFRKSINANFHLACTDMNLELINVFAKLGVDNREHIKAFDAMYFAKNIDGAKWILNTFDIKEESALLKLFDLACRVGSVEIMEWLSTEKNINCYLESCDAFVTACNHTQIDAAKWLLTKSTRIYDDNGCVPAFITVAKHDDSTMIDFLLDQQIDIKKSLDNALREACIAKSKINMLKLASCCADIKKIKEIILMNYYDKFYHELILQLIDEKNYMTMYN